MSAYYNENDPKAAAWLRELIKAGLIAPGDVDERSITEVQPNDLRPYTQCHFFAGIGGWSYALRLAGVRDDERIWTGSCPCQPFSAAGKQLGTADARHLWPIWFGLISQCRPAIIFGEQVASKAGREWYYTGVRPDMESLGYAAGCADLCAAGVRAPHIRQRLWWLAHAPSARRFGPLGESEGEARDEARMLVPSEDGTLGRLADTNEGQCGRFANGEGCERDGTQAGRNESNGEPERCGSTCGLGDANGSGLREHKERDRGSQQPGRETPCGANLSGSSDTGRLGDAGREGLSQQRSERGASCETSGAQPRETVERASASSDAWSRFEIIPCLDGKARRIESGTFPLAHGVSGRVGLLRGYGNAIVPQVAAEFIRAAFEAIPAPIRGHLKRL